MYIYIRIDPASCDFHVNKTNFGLHPNLCVGVLAASVTCLEGMHLTVSFPCVSHRKGVAIIWTCWLCRSCWAFAQ